MDNLRDKKLALIKAKIIIFGIDFGKLCFNNFTGYKMKKKYIQPTVSKGEVFDVSIFDAKIPSEILISFADMQSIVKTRHNSNSPIKARKTTENDILLDIPGENYDFYASLVSECKSLDDQIIVDGEEYKTRDFLSIVGLDRISILLFDGCANWNTGMPCKFCDMHPKPQTARVVIPSTNELFSGDLDAITWWNTKKNILLHGVSEAYKRVKNNIGPHYHNFIMAGALPNASDTWEFVLELLKYIKNDLIGDTIVNVQPHSNINNLLDLKHCGIEQVQYNIEVFGEAPYNDICINKIPYRVFIEKLIEAVNVFGKGNVRSNFVLGLQPVDEVYEGVSMLAELGVVPDYSIFQPKRYTAFQYHAIASLDDVIRCSEFLCSLYMKNKFEPIFCSFSSRSSIMNEMYSAYEKIQFK